MGKHEQTAASAVARALPVLTAALAVALSLFVRILWTPVVSTDAQYFLLPWCEQFRAGGLSAIARGVGDHSILLQYLYWLASVVPIDTIWMIKLYSIAGDYLLAIGVALLVHQLRPRLPQKGEVVPQGSIWPEIIAFSATVLLPLPLINSAYWGQSDVLYACPALFAIYFLIRRKWLPAFLLYGLALAVKLQAIFLLPLFIMVYFVWRRFSALYFLLLPVPLFLSTLPAVVAGASPLVGLTIYAGQVGTYGYAVNYPGLPTLFGDQSSRLFSPPGAILGVLAMLVMLTVLLAARKRVRRQDTILLAAWCVLACVCLLPGMHERYAYLGEVLLWVHFFVSPAKKRLAPAVLYTFTGFCAYAAFVFGHQVLPENILAIINLAALAWLTAFLMGTLPRMKAGAEPTRAGRDAGAGTEEETKTKE